MTSSRSPRNLYRELLLGAATATALLAGCENLPMVRQVREHCANVPEPERQACEDAEYARLYAIERYRNRRIAYP